MKRRTIPGLLVLLVGLAGSAVGGLTQLASAAVVTITHSNSTNIVVGNSVACSPDGGVTTAENSYFRVFDLESFGIDREFIVTSVDFGVQNVEDNAVTVRVNLYTLDGDLLLANLTPIGSSEVTIQPTVAEIVTVPVDGVAPAGSTLVVEIAAPDMSGIASFFIGTNPDGQTGPSYTMSASCEIPEITDLADIGFPGRHIVMEVTGDAGITVGEIEVDPSPSDEGEIVTASVTFSTPDSGGSLTCTVDYGDGAGPQGGTIEDDTCSGPDHIYDDDRPDGYDVTFEICDGEDCDQSSVNHTVNNVAPTITDITTNGPVSPGDPVTVTVNASDHGVNDILMYSFDCDNDGLYDVDPQTGSSADCTLDPAAATSTINVLVEDGDGGEATGSVTVGQVATLCASSYTGALTAPLADGACPTGSTPTELPSSDLATVCISSFTGALTWSPSGSCPTMNVAHIVPNGGPLAYCQSQWTGQLRSSPTGQCRANETPGVIPGSADGGGSR